MIRLSRSPAIVSRVCSIWSPASSKDCAPSAAATGRCVAFLAMAYKPDDPAKPDPRDGLLPLFLVEYEGKEERFYSEKERQEYFAAHNLRLEAESEFESGAGPAAVAAANGTAPRVREIELHEVKMLNKHLTRLRDEFGLRAEVLLPREVTGDDPPPRFVLHRDAETYPLLDLARWSPRCARSVRRG